MSLFIVGSVSRITSNIIHHISKNAQYSSVTIGDLLPTYEYHKRFYRLQKQLDQAKSQLELNLTRIQNLNDLLIHEKFDDVLYVTHDYYEGVVSKTRLMQVTALACKFRPYLYFATPVQYDHFGYANPEQNYFDAEDKVFEINPNSTVIRSDIQNMTETLARVKQTSNANFKPKVVDSEHFAKTVCETMASKVRGKRILVRGTQGVENSKQNKNIEEIEYKHSRENLSQLLTKYASLNFNGYDGQPRKTSKKVQKVQNAPKQQKASH